MKKMIQWILIGISVAVMLWFLWSCCVVASNYDKQSEKWMQERIYGPEEAEIPEDVGND